MPNIQKQEKVKELREKIGKAKSIIFADYQGIRVNDLNEFRQKIKDNGGEISVSKNTLMKIALKEEGVDYKELDGPIAVIFGYEDAISPIKTIYEYVKKLELPKVKAAFIDGVYTAVEKVEEISQLPSKEELLARVVGSLNTPISGIVNVLGGTRRNLVTVLSAVADKQGGEGVS
ncbi:50S ribosomal protein L10 [Patescibacteria group bacterium]